ncbi:hypothetical protein M9H77_21353 [Catharanthus roseus]|uniref:Uncharacterized protein n=1 Tax=Catharanthus roseus TaxID=4058 RepID=A0ACC0AP47_CATRO|nr:hypothetical protein M9H77_21353 [Catharanthus roseus]
MEIEEKKRIMQKIDLGTIARAFGLDLAKVKINGHFIGRGVEFIASSVIWKALLRCSQHLLCLLELATLMPSLSTEVPWGEFQDFFLLKLREILGSLIQRRHIENNSKEKLNPIFGVKTTLEGQKITIKQGKKLEVKIDEVLHKSYLPSTIALPLPSAVVFNRGLKGYFKSLRYRLARRFFKKRGDPWEGVESEITIKWIYIKVVLEKPPIEGLNKK